MGGVGATPASQGELAGQEGPPEVPLRAGPGAGPLLAPGLPVGPLARGHFVLPRGGGLARGCCGGGRLGSPPRGREGRRDARALAASVGGGGYSQSARSPHSRGKDTNAPPSSPLDSTVPGPQGVGPGDRADALAGSLHPARPHPSGEGRSPPGRAPCGPGGIPRSGPRDPMEGIHSPVGDPPHGVLAPATRSGGAHPGVAPFRAVRAPYPSRFRQTGQSRPGEGLGAARTNGNP